MAELLKDRYSPAFIRQLSIQLSELIRDFNLHDFEEKVFTSEWGNFELIERMKHIASTLYLFLPKSFVFACPALIKLSNKIPVKGDQMSLEYMFIPEYISMYGLNHRELAIQTMEEVTKTTSCEFCIRPFILRYSTRMFEQLYQWCDHPHFMVRRLATEGSRPRLPWAMGIPSLKIDPTPIFPILKKLINDEQLIVRRSVANNLNDISKDHPDKCIQFIRQWKDKNENIEWVLKHGSRTMLKKGHPEVLRLFGFENNNVQLIDFKMDDEVKIGNSLQFEFSLLNPDSESKRLRIAYAIYFKKHNGENKPKVFFLREKVIHPNSKEFIKKKQSFAIITTRKYYTGIHYLSVIINGKEFVKSSFYLLDESN